ncbi:MAG TPA: ester cyclase [Stellaceae bacterium]|nr:ester cyclase [Stellaceae bacterium]
MTSDRKTAERNRAVTGRFLEEFKNQHNFAAIDELFSPHASVHLPAEGLPEGPEGQKTIARGIFAAFPDVHVTIDLVIADGDFVAERHTARATHKGEFMGIPATGKTIYWTENHFYRLENGRIQELWSEWSFQKLMDQLTK